MASFVGQILRVFGHFRIVVDFGNKKIKLEKYDANRMDTSTRNKTLKLVQKPSVIST